MANYLNMKKCKMAQEYAEENASKEQNIQIITSILINERRRIDLV